MTYREVARKLTALACRDLPRRGGVDLIGNGSIPNRNALLWFPIGTAKT